jgi:hypothetical protein
MMCTTQERARRSLTAEVALLNRHAVALAADSASTVTYWEEGRQHIRFFKGANKIFHISFHQPVGMMAYDAGTLEGMPWEVIAKAYRDQRGDRTHDTLGGYASDFFDFIVAEEQLFPKEHQEQQFISRTVEALFRVMRVVKPDDEALKGRTPQQADDLRKERFAYLKRFIAESPYIKGSEAIPVEENAKARKDRILKEIDGHPFFVEARKVIDVDEMIAVAANALIKQNWTTLSTTGLAFAGYGHNQYFPHLQHYVCYGILLGKLVCERVEGDDVVISHNNVSDIKPLAQSEMVKTFIYGTSISALVEIDELFVKAMDHFKDGLVQAGHLQADVDVELQKQAAKDQFTDETSSYLSKEHMRPLRNVVGMLSVDELAELAETLILIESLKERVTRPTESVGGPIDVAVISKSDGFVWIKRKHYFDPELNPRFFARKGFVREAYNAPKK